MTFGLDQSVQLQEARDMVDSRQIRLIGPMVSSKVFQGRAFFIGPYYTYVLALLGLLTGWQPLLITQILIIFDLFCLVLFTLWLSSKSSKFLSLLLYSLFVFSPFLIEHSRFYWNPHFLLPVSFLLIYFLEKKRYFQAAIVFGLGFSFHFSAALWVIPFLLYLIKDKINWKIYPLLIFAFILGDLPYFIFEIRHQFYNLSTMYLILVHPNKLAEFYPYYFVFSLSAFLFLLISKISSKYPKTAYFIIVMVILKNCLYYLFWRESLPVGMPPGWDYPTQLEVVDKILLNGCPESFNVATTNSGDTQAHDLRFLLKQRHCPPSAVDSYPHDKTLYLVAPVSRPPQSDTVWEVSSLQPFKIELTYPINKETVLYQLSRINEN
jgi:hypothetical protein